MSRRVEHADAVEHARAPPTDLRPSHRPAAGEGAAAQVAEVLRDAGGDVERRAWRVASPRRRGSPSRAGGAARAASRRRARAPRRRRRAGLPSSRTRWCAEPAAMHERRALRPLDPAQGVLAPGVALRGSAGARAARRRGRRRRAARLRQAHERASRGAGRCARAPGTAASRASRRTARRSAAIGGRRRRSAASVSPARRRGSRRRTGVPRSSLASFGRGRSADADSWISPVRGELARALGGARRQHRDRRDAGGERDARGHGRRRAGQRRDQDRARPSEVRLGAPQRLLDPAVREQRRHERGQDDRDGLPADGAPQAAAANTSAGQCQMYQA